MNKWEDNIKIDLIEIRFLRCQLDSAGSKQGPEVGSYEHGN
jgi:hypothetical protein